MRLKKFNELFDSEELKRKVTSYTSYKNNTVDVAELENIEPTAFSNWLMLEFPFFIDPVYKDKAQIYTFMSKDTYTTVIFYLLSKNDIEMSVSIKQLDTGGFKRYNKKFNSREELSTHIKQTLKKELSDSGINNLNINPNAN